MPDDLVPAGSAEGTERVPPAPAPAGLTTEDVDRVVGARMDQLEGQLSQVIQQLVQQAQQTDSRGQPTPAASTAIEFAQRLVDEGEAPVRDLIRSEFTKIMGPYLNTDIQDKLETELESHQARVDRDYGEGTYTERFQPRLDSYFKSLPPESKASRKAIRTLIHSIEGELAAELHPLRAATTKAREEATAAREAPVMLSGGTRGPSKPQPTEADREFAKTFEKSVGRPMDLDRLAKFGELRDPEGGWSIDDYRKFRDSQKEAS